MHDKEMATDESEYWNRRREVVGTRETNEPDGSNRFVFMIDVGASSIISEYRPLSDRLSQFECLSTTPPDCFHVTVKALDFGLKADTTATARAEAIDRIDTAVTETLGCQEPFETTFPRLNVFPDVVYAEVAPSGPFAELNRRLCRATTTTTLERDSRQYIPHLTLGYYVGDEDAEELVSFLERNRRLAFSPLRVEAVSLATYGLADGWHPHYQTLKTYRLGGTDPATTRASRSS